MRDLKKLTILAGVIGAFMLVSTGARADEPSQKIRILGTLPLKSYATTALQNFKKDVQKGTDSKLEVDLFPACQLYNDVYAVKVIPTGDRKSTRLKSSH